MAAERKFKKEERKYVNNQVSQPLTTNYIKPKTKTKIKTQDK